MNKYILTVAGKLLKITDTSANGFMRAYPTNQVMYEVAGAEFSLVATAPGAGALLAKGKFSDFGTAKNTPFADIATMDAWLVANLI